MKRFFVLLLAAASAFGQARFHHVHMNSLDPAVAMEYFVRNYRSVTVIVPGLGVGVRNQKTYLFFERVDEAPQNDGQTAVMHIGWGSSTPNFTPKPMSDGPDGLQIEVAPAADDNFRHVHLVSNNPEAAGDWYMQHFGGIMRESGPGKTDLMFDNINLVISKNTSGKSIVPSKGRLVDHISFSYAVLGPELERLEKEGLKITDRQAKRAFVTGPDGLSVEIVEDAEIEGGAAYWCPMDPKVRSPKPGVCPVCGMPLVSLDPGEYVEFPVEVEAKPRLVRPGRPVQFRITVRQPHDGERVQNFETVHEKLMHLFVISHDMSYFTHIHPEIQRDGSFVIETVLPKAGPYQLFTDFYPMGGTPQVVQKTIITAGYEGSLAGARARLKTDAAEKTEQGVRIGMKASALISGRKQTLTFTLADAKSGEPVKDLEQYLGASAHLLILSEDLSDYVHGHADKVGSDLTLETIFPRPAMYRLWIQFQRHGKVITVPFTFEVERLK